ncbi:GNAT family N-acetyltransferase [Desulfobulbus elongatus]|uniref:GNAT family N-acetyltransferase n=1 Tax=Desulfobulbus elongatus TaxID=53332 RepID=UPI000486E95D|nr:GNAT family N-acetyltransferase [Desulfobulbus elongatus]
MATVRPARPQDLEPMVGLLRLLFTIEEDFGFDAVKQRQGLALLLNDDRACILVAEEAGQAVGMCTGQLVISTAEGGPAVLVEDVVVAPEHRGRGTGRALMDALTGWARERGATRMQLLADKNNPPALAFYDRLGWGSTALICLRRYID